MGVLNEKKCKRNILLKQVSKMYKPEPLYKLLDWIDPTKIDWNYLSSNPNTIPLLDSYCKI